MGVYTSTVAHSTCRRVPTYYTSAANYDHCPWLNSKTQSSGIRRSTTLKYPFSPRRAIHYVARGLAVLYNVRLFLFEIPFILWTVIYQGRSSKALRGLLKVRRRCTVKLSRMWTTSFKQLSNSSCQCIASAGRDVRFISERSLTRSTLRIVQ